MEVNHRDYKTIRELFLGKKGFPKEALSDLGNMLFLLFSEFLLIGLPYTELCSICGVFLFDNHVLINSKLLSKAFSLEFTQLNRLVYSSLIPIEKIPKNLETYFNTILKSNFESWKLYRFVNSTGTKTGFRFLNKLNPISISRFFEHEKQFSIQTHHLNIEGCKNVGYPSDSFGLYYQSMIPKQEHKNQSMSWILK